jgi:hypothetical protein
MSGRRRSSACDRGHGGGGMDLGEEPNPERTSVLVYQSNMIISESLVASFVGIYIFKSC